MTSSPSRPSLRFLPLLGFIAALALAAQTPAGGQDPSLVSARAGRLPSGQIVTPAGRQVDLPDMRPHVLTMSPDGKLLVTSGRTHEIVVIDPATGVIRQRVPLPAEPPEASKPDAPSANILKPDEKGQVSYTGLVFSPDGRRIYLSNVNGSLKVFGVEPDGTVEGLVSFALPPADAPRRKEEIPSGLAVSPDGKKIYAAFNLSNRLAEIDAADGRILRLVDVGVAPFDVALVGGKAYVSNWGGRRPGPGDVTGPAGRGTVVKVDPETFIANEGSVSVVDLASGRVVKEILVQLHSSALAVSPGGRYVVCANAASDSLSVIDVRADEVVETICAKASPADLFGASPNALAFDRQGKTLYVANGTQNAVAVIRFSPRRRASKLLGLIPVGWWPGAVLVDERRGQLCVANIKVLPEEKGLDKATNAPGYNTHQYRGSLSLIPLPRTASLPAMTRTVWTNYHRERIAGAFLPPRPDQPARPVPERIGEPSVFKHVVYVIKENRTYDQVLGDVADGNGDPALTLFGERVTPNQHKMVRDFVLLDNTYCNGILSAEGHQWSTTAFSTDYMERSYSGWPRSYPDGMGEDEIDALAYAPTGFLWDNAIRRGKSLRSYGEFGMHQVRWADRTRKDEPDWTANWRERNDPQGEIIYESEPAVESLRPYLARRTVGWNMAVSDQFRADYFLKELAEFERKGEMPALILVCLPDDHTSGTKEGSPIPIACVADNDLAFGRIVEGLSKSRFWKDTVVFGIEDDPQNGWDHVSGYRTTAYIASPYTKRGEVVSTFYNTVSLLRTIEQILGLPPMNQFDAAAIPMTDCFTNTPDFRPYDAVANQIQLDELNPPPPEVKDKLLRQQAVQSARLNFRQIDACPEDVLNRILWHSVKGSTVPYPAWAVLAHPAGEDDDD
ncbi:MAG: alkaline phosphatase family protein [Acidobacteriota bacterium]|nr:alkaline phosphatase family protein [Acidobacteriota bacterium]